MTKTSILIICHSFPPFPGIGGRRWAKFAKYLLLDGFDVNVIASENIFNLKSEWTEDVKNISVTHLPVKYPRSLMKFPKSILGRIQYRLDLLYVKLFTKGNYYDTAVFWEKQVIEKASELIQKKNIENVIITGAPFSLFLYGAILKKKFHALKLTADIRDPWTNNRTAYGYNTLSEKRRNYEKNVEKTVFNSYDHVITVNQEMTGYFQNLYPTATGKFVTVMNGFDPEEMDIEEDKNLDIDKAKINLAFTGSFFDSAGYLFDRFLKVVERLKSEGLENKFHFYFFGPNFYFLRDKVKNTDIEKSFSFGSLDKVSKVNGLIKNVDYALLFLTDDLTYSFSTKFCEYIKMRKKILVFSKGGLTGKYVEENGIGFQVPFGNEYNVLYGLIAKKQNNEFPADYDISEFSIKKLTKDIVNLLQLNQKITSTV